jgi:hypothetical protein
MAVLFKDGDQELDYAQKFLCTLYSMTNGLVKEQRDMIDYQNIPVSVHAEFQINAFAPFTGIVMPCAAIGTGRKISRYYPKKHEVSRYHA